MHDNAMTKIHMNDSYEPFIGYDPERRNLQRSFHLIDRVRGRGDADGTPMRSKVAMVAVAGLALAIITTVSIVAG